MNKKITLHNLFCTLQIGTHVTLESKTRRLQNRTYKHLFYVVSDLFQILIAAKSIDCIQTTKRNKISFVMCRSIARDFGKDGTGRAVTRDWTAQDFPHNGFVHHNNFLILINTFHHAGQGCHLEREMTNCACKRILKRLYIRFVVSSSNLKKLTSISKRLDVTHAHVRLCYQIKQQNLFHLIILLRLTYRSVLREKTIFLVR